jgi:hypothetical protein
MSNTTWALILVPALIAMSIFAWYFHREVVLVIICHNGVWAGAIFLVGTNLIRYKEASPQAWLTLAAGLLFFNVGAWFARWPVRLWQRSAARESSTEPFAAPLMTRRVLLIVAVVYAGAFGTYLYTIANRFGLAKLITDPSSIRASVGVSYLESVPLPARILLYLGPLLFVVFGYKPSMNRPFPPAIRISAMAVLTISMLALLQRTNLFLAILWLIALLLTQPRSHVQRDRASVTIGGTRRARLPRWSKKAGPAVAVIALGLIAFISFQAVGGALGKTGQQALSTGAVSQPLADSHLSDPFVYYTAGTVAFLQLADSTNESWPPANKPGGPNIVGNYNPQTWGASTFSPILKAIPGAHRWDDIAPFINTGVLTNVYTWLEPFYRDFRVVGVILGTFLLGLMISSLYRRRAKSARIFWIQAILMSSVFLASFALKVNNTQSISDVVFVLALTADWSRLRRIRPPGLAGRRARIRTSDEARPEPEAAKSIG